MHRIRVGALELLFWIAQIDADRAKRVARYVGDRDPQAVLEAVVNVMDKLEKPK